jgi:hypothetical protein
MLDIKRLLTLIIFTLTIIIQPCITPEVIATDFYTNHLTVPAIEKFPPKIANWSYTPTVIVCSNAPVEEEQIAKAIDFWKKRGFEFFEYRYKRGDPLKKCATETPYGYIVIQLVTQEVLQDLRPTILAETHFFVTEGSNLIEWAKVYLVVKPPETVLEHELGHALGFMHLDRPGHLMHSKQTRGGWGDAGLRR